MQSPTAIAFRALIMLLFLVLVPVAAIFNGQIRDAVKTFLDSHKSADDKLAGPATSPAPLATPGKPAQPFKAAVPAVAGTAAPAQSNSGPGFAGGTQNNGNTGTVGQRAADPQLAAANKVMPAGYTTPGWANSGDVQTNASPAVPGNNAVPLEHGPAQGATAWMHEGGPGQNPGTPSGTPGTASPQPPASSAAGEAGSDQFKQVEHRFQELGATYYRLESWGGKAEYRFYCMMAVGNDPSYNRCFQATDAEPLRAMQQVLQQVEQWRHERPVY